tara:strand:+ start:4074 stop:5381 length:1308 start_codon:yes stop_codon:yes gene_type:complete
MFDVYLSLVLQLVFLIWGAKTIYFYAIEHGYFNFVILTRLLFLIMYVMSGFCHLFFLDDNRGFFDSYYHALIFPSDFFNLYATFLLFIFYFILIHVQIKLKKTKFNYDLIPHFQSQNIFRYGCFLLAIGIVASLSLSNLIDTSVIERGRELPKGAAKFIFISTWFGWGVTFLALGLVKRYRESDLICTILFYISVISITLNVMWMGGRSAVVLLSLPLFFVYIFWKRNLFKKLVVTLLLPFFIYVSYISDVRKTGYDVNETPINQVIDWEFGRFSMLPYSFTYVERSGLLYGSTYFDAIVKTVASPIYFLGLGADFVGDSTGSTIFEVGQDLFYLDDVTYIVPGAIPEAYMNFGLLGVALIAILFGFASKFIDLLMIKNIDRPFNFVFFAYLGSILCFNFLNTTLFAFLNYMIFTGAPLTIAFIFVYFKRMNIKF